jgi:hypothetical protein
MKKYITTELNKENLYLLLLSYVLKKCDRFKTVIRADISSDEQTDDTLNQALNELQPFIISKTKGTEWSVNETSEGSVDIYTYQFNHKTLSILLSYTDDFTKWQAPNFFEDISFFRMNKNEYMLGVIGHENLLFWQLDELEYQALQNLGIELYLNQ